MADILNLRSGALTSHLADDDIADRDASDALLAAGGDMEAFIRLYHGHLTPIYRYVYARLGDRPEAEDVTQQVFERTWSSLRGYRAVAGASFRSWLFTLARRTLFDHFRKGSHIANHVALDSVADELLDPAPGPEEAALISDQVRAVLRVINELPDEAREVITLRFMGDLSYREIALTMDKTEAAVKMAAYRALDMIRRKRSNGDV
ncbi:MAG: RNA polymerase sigma factor [Chloroflexia bacterium]